MAPMRTLGPALVALLLATASVASPAAAQESPAAHHQHEATAPLTQAQLEQLYTQITGREVPKTPVLTEIKTDAAHPVVNANKAFTISAFQFDFDVQPQPFAVNVGDIVTLTMSVPSNDGSTIGHGVLLPPFVTVNIPRGQTVTRTFMVSGPPDDYPFVCTQSGCGFGHSGMIGTMRVNAAVPNPAPTITSLSPTTISTNGGTTVSIFGTNFTSGATVRFDTLSATSVSFVSGTQLTAIAPAHAAGPVTVTVTNPDSQSATSTITYATPGPAITGISPASAPNAGGTEITISGSGFAGDAVVMLGSRRQQIVSISDAQIVIRTSGQFNDEINSPVDVVVTNGDGTSATLAHAFTWTLAPLAITSISPNTGGNGTSVTLRGTGFTNTLPVAVSVGGAAATSVIVVDERTISFTAPAHALGAVDVVLTVGPNSVTSLGGFTYASAPPRRRAVGRP